MRTSRCRTAVASLVAGLAALVVPSVSASASPRDDRACPPAAVALGYSDGLDKLTYAGIELGGLSDLAYDRRTASYAATVDNHGTDPARIWFFRGTRHPHVTRDPLVLTRPDGTPYTGLDADDEGLAILPNGNFLVSSETEPSIRIFGRDGVQRGELRVPARFDVAPAGEATANATLEGLTITPSGDRIVAAMEGTLAGDVASDGTSTWRRFLVYDRNRYGRYELAKQVGYQVDDGMRIAEVQAYGESRLLVLEAAFAPDIGNTIRLDAVTTVGGAPDISGVPDLSAAPAADVMPKQLVADVTACPSLGAPAKETQANPLMDNYEGMAVRVHHHVGLVTLISDDNFSATQTTRLLDLAAVLP